MLVKPRKNPIKKQIIITKIKEIKLFVKVFINISMQTIAHKHTVTPVNKRLK